MSIIKQQLEDRVAQWEAIGHPAIMERFVLRNGTYRKGVAYKGRPGVPKQCFSNATHLLWQGKVDSYEEGFACRPDTHWFLVHHGWGVKEGAVVDPTWKDPEECEYMGVTIPRPELDRELGRNGVYGILDPGMINFRFMFDRDPELKGIVEGIVGHPL